jgi:hypothetical protein
MAKLDPSNPVVAAIERAKITKLQLSRELGIGTTTIWRACTGQKVEPEKAKLLCERFPELDFRALTLGAASAELKAS